MNGFRSSFVFVLILGVFCSFAVDARAQEQTGTVTGTVVDESGTPLPGANLVVPGTQYGTSTNGEGRYVLGNLSPQTYTLRASFIGYLAQEQQITVTAGDTTRINFTLSPDVSQLDEVVVVGYGEQERQDLTGSISSVDGEDLGRVSTSSVEQALQGKISGVQVTPNSGEPGAGAQIRIRGVGTLNNASPLYVVDGMLTDNISFLNSQDIASVEVLKDASATAIYGSRGANGVIIITTKKGERNQGTTFNANVYRGWQEVMNPIDLANAQQYATLANELRASQGQSPAFQNPDQLGSGTDWQDVIYRPAPLTNPNSRRGVAPKTSPTALAPTT